MGERSGPGRPSMWTGFNKLNKGSWMDGVWLERERKEAKRGIQTCRETRNMVEQSKTVSYFTASSCIIIIVVKSSNQGKSASGMNISFLLNANQLISRILSTQKFTQLPDSVLLYKSTFLKKKTVIKETT